MLRVVGWSGIGGTVVTCVEMGGNSSSTNVLNGTLAARLSLAICLLHVALC